MPKARPQGNWEQADQQSRREGDIDWRRQSRNHAEKQSGCHEA